MDVSAESPFDGPGPDAVFRRYLAAGRFCIQRCRDTGRFVFYPRALSPYTGKPNLEWVAASGDGVVYSTTVTRRRKEAGGDYNVALIELAEGVRMMSRVEGVAPTAVVIGMKVKARIAEAGGQPIIVFDPVGSRSDAGIELGQVDGLMTGTSLHFLPTLSVAEYLGIRPTFIDGTMIGGSSFVEHLIPAALALEAGLCQVALICYGSNQKSAAGKLISGAEPQPYEAPYEPRHPIVGYAFAAQRHMHEFGTTREHLAEVAVAARGWAGLNPEAFERKPLAIAEVLGSR